MSAGSLLSDLQQRAMLVEHSEAPLDLALDVSTAHAVIEPAPIDFISYPYEWTFSQLKDAALLTLDAQARALAGGYRLRDASAYNVQFQAGRPILIDTLSFERQPAGDPWPAYRQFCEHFLAPLALMAQRHIDTRALLQQQIDGIPLGLAAALLPVRTRVHLGLATHIHLHARAQARAGDRRPARRRHMSALQHAALADSLRRTIERLSWRPDTTTWAAYADNTSYAPEAATQKDALVERFLGAAGGRVVWDVGANTGRFSAIAARLGYRVVSLDLDPGASEIHYLALKRDGIESTLPLVVDICNPSPGVGWANRERRALLERADADVVLALALVHHLAIGRNIPLAQIAEVMARLGPRLVIEFVPRDDPMVRRLLADREDVFQTYTHDGFRAAFGRFFDVVDEAPLEGSERSLFLMVRRPRG